MNVTLAVFKQRDAFSTGCGTKANKIEVEMHNLLRGSVEKTPKKQTLPIALIFLD